MRLKNTRFNPGDILVHRESKMTRMVVSIEPADSMHSLSVTVRKPCGELISLSPFYLAAQYRKVNF